MIHRKTCYYKDTYSQKQNDMQTKKTKRLPTFRRGSSGPAATDFSSGQPWYELPQCTPVRPEGLVVRRRRVRGSFKAFGLTASVVLLGFGAYAWQIYTQANRMFQGSGGVVSAQAAPLVPELLKGETEGRVNILVLGVPGEGKPGGDLTDTMLLCSIDPVNHRVKLVNIPKDIWVSMPTPYYGAKQKINVAFAAGKYQKLGRADLNDTSREAMQAGFAAADQAVTAVTGIRIHYNIYIDGSSFEKAIDAAGGVELDSKRRLYDPMLSHDNGKNPLILPAGKQTVGGKKALLYARSQAAWGTSRVERQRQILTAFKQKVFTSGMLMNPAKLQQMMSRLGEGVYSDLSLPDAYRLYGMLKNISPDAIAAIDLADPTYLTVGKVGKNEVLRPKAGFDNYSAIQTSIGAQLPDGVLVKENTKLTVVAARRSLAMETAQSLRRQGYAVTESIAPGLVSRGASTALVDLSGGKAAYARTALAEKYGVVVTQTLPEGVVVPSGTEFAIILY